MYALDSTRRCSPSGTAATGEITGCRAVTPPFVVVRKPTPPEIKGVFCAPAFNPEIGRKSSMDKVHVVLGTMNPSFNRINKELVVIGRPPFSTDYPALKSELSQCSFGVVTCL